MPWHALASRRLVRRTEPRQSHAPKSKRTLRRDAARSSEPSGSLELASANTHCLVGLASTTQRTRRNRSGSMPWRDAEVYKRRILRFHPRSLLSETWNPEKPPNGTSGGPKPYGSYTLAYTLSKTPKSHEGHGSEASLRACAQRASLERVAAGLDGFSRDRKSVV